MYYKTKNIWVNIIAHFLNNAIAVIQMFVLSGKKESIDISKLDPKVDWWVGFLAVAVLVMLFKYLHRYSEDNKMKIYAREQALLVNENIGNPLA